MANISAIKRIPFTVTGDLSGGAVIAVPMLWDAAFADTNYVVSFTIEVVGDAPTFIGPFGPDFVSPAIYVL